MSFAALLTQVATYWPPETPDGHDVPAHDPTQILCRWQDKVERQYDGAGREYVSRAILYVTAELQQDGWVVQGASTIADPTDTEAYRIKTVERSQDPGGGIVVWKVTVG
jgi:hypothetical protein